MDSVQRVVCGLAFGWALYSAGAVRAADTPPPTVIEFPSQPVGRYLLANKGTTWQQMSADRSLAKQWKPAQNRVSIPADDQLILALMGQRADGKKPPWDVLAPLHDSQLLSLSFAFSNLLPEDLKRLKRHRNLKTFATTLSKLSDDGLAIVCDACEQLEGLSIPETKITNQGLSNVSKFRNLEQLSLYGTQVTEDGVSHLKELKRLRELNLGLTRVNGSGLRHLKELTQLRRLILWKTNIHDNDLTHLKPLLHLEHLDLKESNFTDAGLSSLTSLKNLKTLDLSYNRITDAGLTHLRSLDQLESLLLHGTNVSKEAADKMKAANPKLKIVLMDEQNLKALGEEAIRQNSVKHRKELDRYFQSW